MASISSSISQDIFKAQSQISTANQLIKDILPKAKDPKLILKALTLTANAASLSIQSFLKWQHIQKNVILTKNPSENLALFFSNTQILGLTEPLKSSLKELLSLANKHKESSLDFVKNNKVVLLDDNLNTVEITKENMLKYIGTAEYLTKRVKNEILSQKKGINTNTSSSILRQRGCNEWSN